MRRLLKQAETAVAIIRRKQLTPSSNNQARRSRRLANLQLRSLAHVNIKDPGFQ